MLLIGDDAVCFNRQFSGRGMDRDILRFSSLIDENVLLASGGASNTRGLLTSAGYFEELATTPGGWTSPRPTSAGSGPTPRCSTAWGGSPVTRASGCSRR